MKYLKINKNRTTRKKKNANKIEKTHKFQTTNLNHLCFLIYFSSKFKIGFLLCSFVNLVPKKQKSMALFLYQSQTLI